MIWLATMDGFLVIYFYGVNNSDATFNPYHCVHVWKASKSNQISKSSINRLWKTGGGLNYRHSLLPITCGLHPHSIAFATTFKLAAGVEVIENRSRRRKISAVTDVDIDNFDAGDSEYIPLRNCSPTSSPSSSSTQPSCESSSISSESLRFLTAQLQACLLYTSDAADD